MLVELNDNLRFKLEGAARSCRSAMIVLQKPAQARCKNNFPCQISILPLPGSQLIQRFVILALMRTFKIVPSNVFSAEIAQMFLANLDKMIETFLLDALHKPLSIGIEICPLASQTSAVAAVPGV